MAARNCVAPRPLGTTQGEDAEHAGVEARARGEARDGRAVGPVRDLDDVGALVPRAVRAVEPQVERLGSRGRASVAAPRARSPSWRRDTRAICTMVAYRPSDTLFTNTRPLTSARSMRVLERLAVGVESADDVGAVESQVEGEVVARARRDDDHRDAALGGHAGDQRLGAVAARHADDVGSAVDGVSRERREGRRPAAGRPGSIPRVRHSSTRWKRSAFPPPDLRFMISVPRLAAGTGVPGVALLLEGAHVAGERVPGEPGDDQHHDEAQHAARGRRALLSRPRGERRATPATVTARATQRRTPVRVSASQAASPTRTSRSDWARKSSGLRITTTTVTTTTRR